MKKFLSTIAFGMSVAAFAQEGDLATMEVTSPAIQSSQQEEVISFELVSFVADPVDGEGISIHWNTGAELPHMLFTVERSRDRMNWRPAFTQDGEGGTTGYNGYSVMDLEPIAGISYYRLVASADGREIEVSDDFAVEYVKQADLLIKNEHIPGYFSVHGDGQITEMRLLNNRGQFVPMQLEYRENAVFARTEGLEPGTYFVQATVDGTPILRQVWVGTNGVIGG